VSISGEYEFCRIFASLATALPSVPHGSLGILAKDKILPTFRLIQWSAVCLFYGVAPLSAQLAGEQVKELPFKVLTRSIDLGGAVEDADIAPDGEYTAAAVRKCGMPGGSRTCTLDIEVYRTADSKGVASRTLLTNVHEVAVAIRVSAGGHTLVISDGRGKLHLWLMTDLIDIDSIDLGLTSEDFLDLQERYNQETAQLSKQLGHPIAPRAPRVMQIESSPSSPLIAVVISVGRAEMIRVFDLTSGKLLHSWSFMNAFRTAAVSWSQDGRHLAISLLSTRGMKHPERTDPANLLIYDVLSGQLAAKFEIRAAGRVVFAGDYLIDSTSRMPGTFFKPTLRVFDSRTGNRIRTIGAEGTGVRDPIAISADGKVLLGFVGHVRKEMIWSDLTTVDVPFDARIRLWEMPAGKLIFVSEDLPLIPKRASFRLNAAGNRVIAFDQGTKLLLFQLK
jgi:WD40 repeat protein